MRFLPEVAATYSNEMLAPLFIKPNVGTELLSILKAIVNENLKCMIIQHPGLTYTLQNS